MKIVNKLDLKPYIQYWVKPKDGEWFVGCLDGTWMVSKIREVKLSEVEEVRELQTPDELTQLLQ